MVIYCSVKNLFYLNKYLLHYKWHLLLGLLFVFLSNYFKVWQPKMIREALDLVVDNISLLNNYDGFEMKQQILKDFSYALFLFGFVVILLAFTTGFFMYWMRQTVIVMSRLIEYDLRKEVFTKYESLDLAFYKRNKTGDLMSRITEDVSKVRMYLGPVILYGMNLTTLTVLVMYSMFSVNVKMSLYSLAPLPFLSLSIYYVSSIINRKSTKIQQQLAVLNNISQEVYSGIRVVKSYVQEKTMGKMFSDQSEAYKGKAMELAKIDAMFYPLMILLIGISTIITVLIGGFQVAKGEISPGNIAEFVIYVNMLTWPVTSIGWIASIIQQAEASQKRLNEFLEVDASIINNPEVSEIQGAIEFKNVDFVYPDTGIKALSDVNFKLPKGGKLAIVGKTGSGKTSIADLLVRMYDVSSGEINIDGNNIQKIDLNILRKNIGYVPQDIFLYSDTINSNIIFGLDKQEKSEIEKYAKYAAVHEDILTLNKGYDTLVGERGVTLSGGQKQRITIARALIKKPQIVILDDCLSAVDTSTEKHILSHLEKELKDKTTVIITHRIYSFFTFDKILVLDNGRITEEGTHEQLLANKGFYYDMFEKQQLEDETIKY